MPREMSRCYGFGDVQLRAIFLCFCRGAKANDDIASTDLVTSSFRWDVIPPKVRMRRDVVFSFEDLLVSFGGTLALFLGFSQISIVRIAYVTAYHLIMTSVELICRWKKSCGCRWRIFKHTQATKKTLLVQTAPEERPKIHFGSHKRRQQFIATHARVIRGTRLVGANDDCRDSE
ncbi:unnamed protein product [Ceratitis capitata]|uniref:(Mediterranean fruit fly) hypothetical protein n=1 Tax=Ceratitis capitata TaxID=7213 RepID=A0A811VJC9_CERCA|nr:unnamed protein product [Ceratitis capitata]